MVIVINSSRPLRLVLSFFILAISPALVLYQAIFQRYPRPEKEYQSFSLIHSNDERSLDLVSVRCLSCKETL